MNQAMPQLLPCTWTVNEAALSAAAESWMHEVCSKVSRYTFSSVECHHKSASDQIDIELGDTAR